MPRSTKLTLAFAALLSTSAVAFVEAPVRPSLAGQYRYVLQGSISDAQGAHTMPFYESGTIVGDAQGHFTGRATQTTAAASCTLATTGIESIAPDGDYHATGSGVVTAGGKACSGGPFTIAGPASADGSIIAFGSSVKLPNGEFEVFSGTAVKIR